MDMAANKALMVNSSRGFIGGVERMLVSLADSLRQSGWQVYGLFEQTVYEDPDFDAAFEQIEVTEDAAIDRLITDYLTSGINAVIIHKCSRPEWIASLRKSFPVAVVIHDHDYYCPRSHKYFPFRRINCHLPYNPLYCLLCSGLVKGGPEGWRLPDISKQSRLLKEIRACESSFVLSDYMAENLVQNGWDKAKIRRIIPWQEVFEEKKTQSCESFRILFVGQLIRGKGVDLLLSALAELKFNWTAVIAGRGNDEEFLKNLANTLGIYDRLDFVGWTARLEAYYGEADLVVVPSRWQEPFGLVGLEAFAHGKAVVAYDIGGITQWLKHGKTGLLARAGSVESLAKAIRKIATNPQLKEKLEKAGREYLVREYNRERHLESLLGPLNELINNYGEPKSRSIAAEDQMNIFDIEFLNISMENALETQDQRIRQGLRSPVFFVNADCLNKAYVNLEYKKLLQQNELVYPDGSGIALAGKILGTPLRENLNGTDMLPKLCELALRNSYSIFLLGAAPGVAEQMRTNLILRYPDLKICGVQHGFFDWKSEAETVITKINQAQPDILLVAFGAPRQEIFIDKYGDRINATIQMGVGGLFDFYSGRIPRAPLWMRQLGIEWIFRLIQEPGRMWRRYILGNPLFLYRVFRWKKSQTA